MNIQLNSSMDVSSYYQVINDDPQATFIAVTDIEVVSYEFYNGQNPYTNPLPVIIKAGTKLVRHPEYTNSGYGPAMQKLEHSYNDRHRWFELNFNQFDYYH